MQIHQSAEDYLETILMLTQRMGKVRSIDVVNELGFTKASVSIAMKKLRENGYIAVDGEGNLTLLEPGREIAERIYSRHRLLTHFFMQLGVDEKTALCTTGTEGGIFCTPGRGWPLHPGSGCGILIR